MDRPLNKGHEIADNLLKLSKQLWTEPGQTARASYLETQAVNLKLFADIFSDLCEQLFEGATITHFPPLPESKHQKDTDGL